MFVEPDVSALSHEDSPIIVIGMGSSGTRMVVDILERCGVFMGGDLSHNDFREPEIFFAGINAFTEAFRYLDPLPVEWESTVRKRADEVTRFSRDILPLAYAKAGYKGGKWGFKDPRNTFVLPLYLNEFTRCRILNVVRDGRDVALSKSREFWPTLTHGSSLERWFNVWRSNVSVARSYRNKVQKGRFYEVRYEDLCLHANQGYEVISALLDVDVATVRTVVKAVAHQSRVAKWQRYEAEFEFAKSDLLLKSYGYDTT